jgi:hypothetical protein
MRILVIAVSILAVMPTAFAADAPIPASEREALEAIFGATGGVNWTHREGWGGEVGTECNWYGVECAPDYEVEPTGNHVVGLNLRQNNLVGVIPD